MSGAKSKGMKSNQIPGELSTAEVTMRFGRLREQFEAAGANKAKVPIVTLIRWKCPTITEEQVKRLSYAFAGRCTRKDAELLPLVEKALAQLNAA
jgi:hypothetical protein